MKENKYDDGPFFEKYARMARSREGLKGAGEWKSLEKILSDFASRRVLDLGCGYGWHCVYAAEHGALSVLGTDISEKMLAVARNRTDAPEISYERAAMEDLDFAPGSFDVVLSSLALHYVEDYAGLARRVRGWLAPGGDFVFSVEHPIFTAQGGQDWVYGEGGEILHFPVDNYSLEGPRAAVFLGERVTKYHRTLTTYLETLLTLGFRLRHVVEPEPPADMPDEMRRPMMLLIAAVRD